MILTSNTIKSRYTSFVIQVCSVIFLFFCTTNRLIPLPIDKVMVFALLGLVGIWDPSQSYFKAKELALIVVIFGLAVLSSAANVILAPMIFFPALGIAFSITIAKHPRLIISSLFYALGIHILLAIIFVVLALKTGIVNDYVWSMREKGLPNVFSARGFTATVQTFGTLCMLWVVIYFIRKKQGLLNNWDRFFFVINLIGILITLNRSTYIFWMIILFFKMRKLFWSIMLFVLAFVIRFWFEIMTFLTNKDSLTARSELLEGFNISFWDSNSPIVYIFGRGINQYSPEVLAKVKWDYRTDIENGYAMILHTYGFLGLIFYVTACLFFISKFMVIRRYAEAVILFYFLFVAPYFTQEFVSTTFYLFIGTMILLYNMYKHKYQFVNE